jgi:hypothetical protein
MGRKKSSAPRRKKEKGVSDADAGLFPYVPGFGKKDRVSRAGVWAKQVYQAKYPERFGTELQEVMADLNWADVRERADDSAALTDVMQPMVLAVLSKTPRNQKARAKWARAMAHFLHDIFWYDVQRLHPGAGQFPNELWDVCAEYLDARGGEWEWDSFDENWGFLEMGARGGSDGDEEEESDDIPTPPPAPRKKKKDVDSEEDSDYVPPLRTPKAKKKVKVLPPESSEEDSDEEEPVTRRRGRPKKKSGLEEQVEKLTDLVLGIQQQQAMGGGRSSTMPPVPQVFGSSVTKPAPVSEVNRSLASMSAMPRTSVLSKVLEEAMEDEATMIPDLESSGARVLMNTGVPPLRVSKKVAPSLLWVIFGSYTSSVHFVQASSFKKRRNEREARTIAVALDLAICQNGIMQVAQDPIWEVMLRRMMAVRMADAQDTWKVAEKLEVLPPTSGSDLPAKLDKELMTLVDLETKMEKTASGKGTTKEE